MKIDIKTRGGYWFASVVVKSGKRYTYNCAVSYELTEMKVRLMWQESRKYWKRVV